MYLVFNVSDIGNILHVKLVKKTDDESSAKKYIISKTKSWESYTGGDPIDFYFSKAKNFVEREGEEAYFSLKINKDKKYLVFDYNNYRKDRVIHKVKQYKTAKEARDYAQKNAAKLNKEGSVIREKDFEEIRMSIDKSCESYSNDTGYDTHVFSILKV